VAEEDIIIMKLLMPALHQSETHPPVLAEQSAAALVVVVVILMVALVTVASRARSLAAAAEAAAAVVTIGNIKAAEAMETAALAVLVVPAAYSLNFKEDKS
jgi:hypothetical protein